MAATLILLSIGLPWLGALLVWAIGSKRSTSTNISRLQHTTATVFSAAAGLAALALLAFPGSQAVISIPMGDYFGELTFVPDGLGVFLAVIATVIGSLAVVFSIDYMHGDSQLGRYYFLGPFLHRRDGRACADGQHAFLIHFLGDHCVVFVCADLFL